MGVRPLLIALCGASFLFAGCKQQSAATPLAEASGAAESSTQPAGEALRLQGYVNDAAGVLSQEEEKRLSASLRQLERDTGHQMVVATTPSLGGKDISAYSLALARRWGIGRKGINDGVVILLAPGEHKARIEVGYGLERTLPDPLCQTIMEQNMIPDFRTGKFGAGLEKGVAALSKHLH
ncbi:TPM domain-containing protein [Novosphingobium sp. BL-8H]|uniref:TPM domain-containing protein n=1 Tax=Novosphingobium sp. BL-8H TaxID=3127640 RepID=UPI003757E380